MSMDQQAGRAETQQQQQQGQETFLSHEERAQLRRLMGHPEDYPKEMMAHVKAWLEVNPPDVPIGQLRGNKGVPRYVARSATQVQVNNTGTETTIFTGPLKGKTVSPTGQIRVLCFWSMACSDVSNSIVIRVKLGGTTVLSVSFSTDTLDGNTRQGCFEAKIVNAGAYNSQLGLVNALQNNESGGTSEDRNVGSSSIDLSQDKDLTITADWGSASAGATFTFSYAAVEVFNPVGS